MATLQRVLLGCTDRACLEQAKSNGKKVLLLETPAKALKQAGTLSENLMLAYVQGMVPEQPGWGHVNGNDVARIITLHNDAFAANDKLLPAARARGGNLLAHIAGTMDAAAHASSTLPSLRQHGERVVVLVGHDTGLAGQAGLLQLDWHNNVQTDDYPPAGALIYQLLEHHGHYAVRLFVAQPTLGALLAGEVTGKNAMRVAPLRLPTCGHRIECPLSRFDAIVQRVVEPAVIDTDSGHEPVAQ